MEKSAGIHVGPAELNRAELINVQILGAIFQARFVDLNQLQVFVRELLNKPEEVNIYPSTHH